MQVALTDDGGSYDDGPEVVFEVHADRIEDFRTASDYINGADLDVLCVQHEFGIFGGSRGRTSTSCSSTSASPS